MAELIGPVEANRHNSAATIAGQYNAGEGAARATSVSGAATSVASPETHRYACFESRSNRSPSQPPPYVPRNPVTTTIAPNCTVAWALGMPRARSRNAGVQNASAPIAKVYAAYPRTVSTYGRLRSSAAYAARAAPASDTACAPPPGGGAPPGSLGSWAPRGGSYSRSARAARTRPGAPATKKAHRHPK